MSVVRPHGRSVADERRPRRLVVRTTRMSVVTMRRSRRLTPWIPLITTSAVSFQAQRETTHCALITAVELAAIRIASLALGVSPAPVSRTDEHPICERIMITYGRGANRERRGLTKEGKRIKPSPGVWKDKHSVFSQSRRVADGRRRQRSDENQPNMQIKSARIVDDSLGLTWRGEPTSVVDCGEVISSTNTGAVYVFHDT